jgi:colicin import membrane protein
MRNRWLASCWLTLVLTFGGSGVTVAQDEESADDPAIYQARAEWVQLLAQHIAMKWMRPPGIPPGLRVKLRIEIAETGRVERVEVAETSGNETFDTSARFAVLKASPLPLPADPRAFVPVLMPTLMPAAPRQPENSL